MDIQRSKFWLGAVLLVSCLLVQPVGIGAQCMTAATSNGTGTQGGMVYRYGAKFLSGAYQCTLTMQMNMIGCTPDPSANTSAFFAQAFTTATNPTCVWDCGCGELTMNNVDLPVELMDFGIEGEAAEEESDETDGGSSGTR